MLAPTGQLLTLLFFLQPEHKCIWLGSSTLASFTTFQQICSPHKSTTGSTSALAPSLLPASPPAHPGTGLAGVPPWREGAQLLLTFQELDGDSPAHNFPTLLGLT